MFVLLRTIERYAEIKNVYDDLILRLDKLKLDTDSILDDKKLSKQFVVRSFKFPPPSKTLDSPLDKAQHLQEELE